MKKEIPGQSAPEAATPAVSAAATKRTQYHQLVSDACSLTKRGSNKKKILGHLMDQCGLKKDRAGRVAEKVLKRLVAKGVLKKSTQGFYQVSAGCKRRRKSKRRKCGKRRKSRKRSCRRKKKRRCGKRRKKRKRSCRRKKKRRCGKRRKKRGC